jgi:ribosome-binding protein aMBF1 (putative translation factor)
MSELLKLADEAFCELCGSTNEVEEVVQLCADCYHDTFGTWPEDDEAAGTQATLLSKEGDDQ